MKFNWKKALTTTAVLAFGSLVAVLASKNKDEFGDWLETATDDELSDGYEERRQEWARTGFGGNGEKTPEMKRIDREMSRRSAEKWENDPRRNTDPDYRWTDANHWDKDYPPLLNAIFNPFLPPRFLHFSRNSVFPWIDFHQKAYEF